MRQGGSVAIKNGRGLDRGEADRSRVRSAGRLNHLDIDHDTGLQNATIAGSVRSLPATKATRHHNVARRSAGDKR